MEIRMIQDGQPDQTHGAFAEEADNTDSQDRAVTLRTFRWDDLDSLLELTNRVLEADHADRRTTLDDVRHDFEKPSLEPESNCFVAVTPDGTIVGSAGIEIFDPEKGQAHSYGNVHPDYRRRGIGTRLVRATEARLVERARTEIQPDRPLFILRYIPDTNTGDIALLEAEGYQPVRYFYEMRIDLDGPIEPPRFPDGISLRPFDQARDAQAVYRADMDAFSGHWGFSEFSFDKWAHEFIERPDFDPSLLLIAWHGPDIAGLCLNYPWRDAQAEIGFVDDLGVLQAYRRRGLGLALLRESFRRFQKRGYRQANLFVDTGNATNALALYKRAGMHVHRRTISFRKILRGSPADIED
jgi:mycothiol synthase